MEVKLAFLGVIETVLFFSFVSSVIGLEKLSTTGVEGRVAIDGRRFVNGERLSGNKKIVSLEVSKDVSPEDGLMNSGKFLF